MTLTITLAGAGGTIEGQVRDHAGRPVAGAAVQIEALDVRPVRIAQGAYARLLGPLKLRTEADGTFVAEGVAVGRARVQARSPASATAERAVVVAEGQVQRLELTLQPEATVSGSVRDETGAPVPGAQVVVGNVFLEFGHCATTSRTDGSFRLRGAPAGVVKVWAWAGDDQEAKRASVTLTLAAGEDHPCELVVAPPALATQVRGRVVDSKSAPLAGWRLSFRPTGWTSGWSARATTDADGAFAVGNCPPSVEVTLSGPSIGLAVLEQDEVAPGGPDLVLRVPDELMTPATLTGRLVDETGMPVDGATIFVHPLEHRSGVTLRTAADGTFSDMLPALRYAISIAMPDRPRLYLPDLELRAGQPTDLGTVRLARSGALVAQLTDPEGKPIPPASASVSIRGNHIVASFDPDGPPEQSLPLAPGHYVLRIDHPGMVKERIAFEIEEGKETVVSAKLRATFLCVVHLSVPPGQPPASKPRWSLRDAGGREVDSGVWSAPQADMNITLYLAPGAYVFECEDALRRRAGGGLEVIGPSGAATRVPVQVFRLPLR